MFKLSDEKIKLYNDRQKLINKELFPNDLTIISNTCIGGRLYHDYGRKFLSPTIDFYMDPNSFVKFCLNLKYYMNCDIRPLPDYRIEYLNGFLACDIGGLIALFGHTNDSYEKIITKWNERKKRINYDNIVVICTDRNVLSKPFTRCSDKTVKEFGKISYKKVLFSIVDYKYDYIAYLPSFKDEEGVPEATRPSLSKRGRYIVEEDGFDLDRFLCNDNLLLHNIDKLHTTKLGVEKIKRNLNINSDVVNYLKNKILDKNCVITKKGKNYYCMIDNIIITVNSYNYCIITAHLV